MVSFITLIVISILFIVLVSSILMFAISVARRIINSLNYRKLDEYKKHFREFLTNLIRNNLYEKPENLIDLLSVNLKSKKGSALMEVLVELYNEYPKEVNALARILRLDEYYVNTLRERIGNDRLIAVKILCSLGFFDKFPHIVEVIKKEKDPSLLYRMLFYVCKNVNEYYHIKEISKIIASKHEENMLSAKEIEVLMSLFIKRIEKDKFEDFAETIASSVSIVRAFLNSLYFKQVKNREIIKPLFKFLKHEDEEVISGALRVLHLFKGVTIEEDYNRLFTFLQHEKWYIRLNAIRALEAFGCNREIIERVSRLIYDENWQVRSASAELLVTCMDKNLDIILRILESGDTYAKQAVAEAISKLGAMLKLKLTIKNMEKDALFHVCKIAEILYTELEFRNTITEEDLREVKLACTM